MRFNLSTPMGFTLGAATILFTLTLDTEGASFFYNPHAIVIVFGGTLAAALICFPLKHFVNMTKIFFSTIMGKGKQEMVETISEISNLAKIAHSGQGLETQSGNIKNFFLKEAVELMLTGGLTDEELEEVLEKRVELQNEKYKSEGITYKIIGKFPPAFGLIGTTLGMISLLQGLGGEDAFRKIGPSMGTALVATFYGLVLANLIMIPVGENLARASEEDLLMRKIVVDGILLIKDKKHPLLVEEYLKSYITPGERKNLYKNTA